MSWGGKVSVKGVQSHGGGQDHRQGHHNGDHGYSQMLSRGYLTGSGPWWWSGVRPQSGFRLDAVRRSWVMVVGGAILTSWCQGLEQGPVQGQGWVTMGGRIMISICVYLSCFQTEPSEPCLSGMGEVGRCQVCGATERNGRQRASLHPTRPCVTRRVWVSGHDVHRSEAGEELSCDEDPKQGLTWSWGGRGQTGRGHMGNVTVFYFVQKELEVGTPIIRWGLTCG